MAVEIHPRTVTPVLRSRRAPSNPAGVALRNHRHTRLYRTFCLLMVGLAVLILVKGYGQPPLVVSAALIISATALFPSYLWVSRKVHGLPIFPLYALTATWIYALPLVYEHPMILLFPPWFQFQTALSVAGFLVLGTAVWYLVVRRPIKPQAVYWMLDETGKNSVFLLIFGVTFLFILAASAGWLRIGMSAFTLLRTVVTATQALICFVLGLSASQGKLSPLQRLTFYAILVPTLVVSMASLLLINAMSLLGLVVLAHVIGSRKLPLLVCALAMIVLSFLHVGKAQMREKYWHEDEELTVSPTQYFSFFKDWVQTSSEVMRNGDPDDAPESLPQRASLMHLLLYIEGVSPGSIPFLNGESYGVIPILFVPRMFYPDKPRSLEGSYIILIHYGLQTREDTDIVAIDVGLIIEAFANFGYAGMAGLAVILGGFFGWVTRWSRSMPILSFRSLFGVLVLGSILQASSSAGFYIASLFQGTIVLLCCSVLVMRNRRPDPARASFLE